MVNSTFQNIEKKKKLDSWLKRETILFEIQKMEPIVFMLHIFYKAIYYTENIKFSNHALILQFSSFISQQVMFLHVLTMNSQK